MAALSSKESRRTLIWPLLSIGAPRNAEVFFLFRGVATGLLLTASLTAAWDFRPTASACRCTKHLSKGRPPWPENHGDCGTKVPRPRNSSVPPCRPFKTAGSAPRGVPVRFWLGGRAATRRTFTAILQGFPGRAPCRGLIQPSGSAAQASARGQGLGVHNTPAHRTLAPSWPQLAHQLPGTVRLVLLRAAVGRRVFEETDRGPEAVCYEAKNRLLSKTSRLRSRW